MQSQTKQSEDNIDFDRLILLDSFLKEPALLRPSDSISVRRKAHSSFTFSDGLRVLRGKVACVPLRDVMRNSASYPDDETFDGYYFVDKGGMGNTSRYTDGNAKFPL